MFVKRQTSSVRTEHFPFKTCGQLGCSYCVRSAASMKVKDIIGRIDDFFYGSSPAPFVGRYGYPFVNVGVLAPPDETSESAWKYDAPRFWAEQQLQIPEIVGYRSALVNSRFKDSVYSARSAASKLLEASQEVGMSSKPVDMELNLSKRPVLRMSVDSHAAPVGPAALLKSVRLTSNPNVKVHVEKVVSDTDLKAADAVSYLYDKGYDENFLMRLLSVGNLGMKTGRKLVPTRWSITASHDIIGKKLLAEIKKFTSHHGYFAHFSGYLGNYFLVLFFPEDWSFELFETAVGSPDYTTDYEHYKGRTSYAENCAGGYYAARLGVVEALSRVKRQGRVLVLRFITKEYTLPLGVWVVLAAVRKALENRPVEFGSKELMLAYACSLAKKKFGYSLDVILKRSLLLESLKQRKLSSYLV